MVATIKFSAFAEGGDLTEGDITVGLGSATPPANTQFTNPWTFLPSGTTGDRPLPLPENYYRLRFNTQLQTYEYYDPIVSLWIELSGSGTGTVNPGLTNDIPFYPANGVTLSPIASVALAVLGTDGSGVPALLTTLPIDLTIPNAIITGSTAALTSGQVAAAPVNPTDLTNKTYVDTLVAGSVTSITGTTNQIIASTPTGAVTLSLPQDIATGSSPTFSALTLSSSAAHGVLIGEAGTPIISLLMAAGTVLVGTTAGDPVAALIGSGQNITVTNASGAVTVGFSGNLPVTNLNSGMLASATTFWNGAGVWAVPPGTGVTSVLGTANRITSSGGTTPSIDISAAYVGQTSISTLGTIGTGVWQGSLIAPTYGGTGVNNGANTLTLAGTLATVGAFASTFTMTGPTSLILPTTGTLATTAGTVSSVSGTANRITSTGGTTPIIDISAAYIGQTSITTLGTITTGVWNGTLISPTFGGTGVNNGASTLTLSGGFANTFLFSAPTTVSFPTAGTLATVGGTVSSIVGTQNQVLANATFGLNETGVVTLTIAGNPVLPGTGGVTLPTGNTAARAGIAGTMRFNSQTTVFEGTVDGTNWAPFETALTGVVSVSGTAGQITSTGGTTPVIGIDPAYIGQTSITTLGTIGTGTWQGSVIGGTYGGTGVNNGASTVTLGGSLTTSGAFATTLTVTGPTNLTLPTTGTLATTATASGIVSPGLINQLAYYAAAGSTLSGVTIVNSAMLTTTAGGVPTWVTTTGSGFTVKATSPTFTTPILGAATATSLSGMTGPISAPTFINDSSGNHMLAFLYQPSAVNYISVVNNTTGNYPSLVATGTDPNISFRIGTTGTGYFIITTAALTTPFQILSGTAGQHSTQFSFANTAAADTYTFPDASGTLLMTGQAISTVPSINFGGSTLSTYVQGTFSPVLTSSGGGTATYSIQQGQYTQIGNVVFFRIFIVLTALPSAGSLTFTGLPSTAASYCAVAFAATNLATTAITSIQAQVIAATSSIGLYTYASGLQSNLQVSNCTSTSQFDIGGQYFIS